jgi:hypothetical protein
MALSPQLLQFKSSGVYRLEFDKSQTTNFATETIRLVVGHSKKGPYNTPVFVETTEDFNTIFGSIDRNLEKKGMFFHRSALSALSRGPILAINLSSFESSDLISYASPVTNGSDNTAISLTGDDEYTKFFNTDKFWFPSDEATISTIGTEEHRVINFINIKQEPITLIVRKAQNVANFDVTAREWYGEGNVPEYMNDKDYISDFMIDVLVFKGEFNPSVLVNDPVYKNYFNSTGLIKGQLDAFSNLRQVTLVANYTGSLIPNFKDLEGRNLYIETIINSEARRTGLFCAVDEDAITNPLGTAIDLVGHVYDKDQNYELLSYIIEQKFSPANGTTFSLEGLGDIQEATTDLIEVPSLSESAITVTANEMRIHTLDDISALFVDKYIENAEGSFTPVTSSTYVEDPLEPYVKILTSALSPINNNYSILDPGDNLMYGNFIPATTTVGTGSNENKLFVSNTDIVGLLEVGDFLLASIAGEFTEITSIVYDSVTNITTITCEDAISEELNDVESFKTYSITNNRVKSYNLSENGIAGTYANLGGGIFTITYNGSISNITLRKGYYVGSDERLSKIKSVTKQAVVSGGVTTTTVTVTTDSNVSDTWPGEYVVSFEDATEVYKPFIISKAHIGEKSIVDSLSALNGTDLFYALADKDLILYRYIVDTFGSFDTIDGIQNKRELSFLAHERQNVAAILNAPTIADFKKSTNPSFTDASGTFDIDYIKDGGNLDKNPSSFYTLPSIADGANYAFYYGPGLIIRENGKDIIVPPAAYVSNNYIDKYSNALPWSIIAGPRRGVVSGTGVVGVEYAFDKLDRDILEPFGINPIVFQRGVGLTILANKTAQQSVKSALSSAHVREVLIYIQEGLANILKDYVFEFNTAQTRLEIKTLADAFMESVKADQGVYDFKNVIDQTNNTNEVIDNNIGILDTFVEPVKGLEIVVHRTTVLNTGEIQTGNFS